MAVRTGAPARSQRWPRWVLWKLGSFIFLILLETIDCSANPSYLPDNNHNPSVNIYMSLEEVKKLLGKAAAGLPLARGSSRSVPPPVDGDALQVCNTSEDWAHHALSGQKQNNRTTKQPQNMQEPNPLCVFYYFWVALTAVIR